MRKAIHIVVLVTLVWSLNIASYAEEPFRFQKNRTTGWSIYGVQPGQSFKQLRAKFPTKVGVVKVNGSECYSICDEFGHQVNLVLDKDGLVDSVGMFPVTKSLQLEMDGKVYITGEDTQERVVTLLGGKLGESVVIAKSKLTVLRMVFDLSSGRMTTVQLYRPKKNDNR